MRRPSISRFLQVAAGLLAAALSPAQDARTVPPAVGSNVGVAVQARAEAPRYGTTDLTYVPVTGSEFFPRDGGDYKYSTLVGRYPITSTFMLAPLHVPGGSVIDFLEIDFCDGLDPEDIFLFLFDCDRIGSDCVLVANVNSFAFPGCSSISTSGFAHQVDNVGRALVLEAQFQKVNDHFLVLNGAVVGYRLSVSPAPAQATFNDVPTDHPFFQFVEALQASGITAGCNANPPLYCPDAPLTRGQMAVFLAKALGLHWQ
jgi:hypothetical protein